MYSQAVDIKNASVYLGGREILHNLSWQVPKGGRCFILGANGAGKTTLVKMLMGYAWPVYGARVEILGNRYGQCNLQEVRKKIGWVSSSYFDKYYTRESALDIVLSGLCGTLGKDSTVKPDDYIRAKALLKEWNMDRKFDLPFYTMSKGERQNVLIARALISNPEILVLDEPGTGLDVLAREQLLRKISAFAEENNLTIIYVTHYPEEILPVFDKCLVLQRGKMADIGPLQEVMSTERLSHTLETDVVMQYMQDGRMDLRVK